MAPDMDHGCIHWTKKGHLDVVQVPPYRIRSRRQGPGPRFLFFDSFELQYFPGEPLASGEKTGRTGAPPERSAMNRLPRIPLDPVFAPHLQHWDPTMP
ncbi:hypothetical protein CDV31_007210 [Fusarium ambrosium]|uniref:Uncharacterized protein n=1 Tax=Fusarium ambrosium TaxID=131363 RepID=A0A428U894_9HYPO|nr:hypothetical protein CDV31_007210 [Fusarium ambrosium]